MLLRISLMLFAAVTAPAKCLAADNPFGLPAPRDPSRPGMVMLHGAGPSFDHASRLEFVRLAGGRTARIILIPSDTYQRGKDDNGKPVATGAVGRDDEGNEVAGNETAKDYEARLANVYSRWVALRDSGVIQSFQFVAPQAPGEADDQKHLAALEQATGVWLTANDQEYLPKILALGYPPRMTRFQVALREVVARGGIVGGHGGGMSALPETMIAGDADGHSGWNRARVEFGLGLFDGAVVDQNFNYHSGRLERMTDLLRNGPVHDRYYETPGVDRRTIGIGVDRGTAVILRENTIRAIGSLQGHIFLKSNGDRTITYHKIQAGDPPLVIQAGTPRSAHGQPVANPLLAPVDNPFGVPEPDDPQRLGTIVLHGGGDWDGMVDELPAWAGNNKPALVLCPSASARWRPESADTLESLLPRLRSHYREVLDLVATGRLSQVEFLATNDPQDANRKPFVAPLESAQAVWFTGGAQEDLARLFVDRWRPTLFQEHVYSVLRRGGMVGGTSAGLAIMAEIMIASGDPQDNRPAQAELSHGLGVLKYALIDQHFDAREGRIERLMPLLVERRRLGTFLPAIDPRKLIGLAVDEKTALLVRGNRVQVVGNRQSGDDEPSRYGTAHIFLPDENPNVVTWHSLRPGDAALVRPGPTGWVLEMAEWHAVP